MRLSGLWASGAARGFSESQGECLYDPYPPAAERHRGQRTFQVATVTIADRGNAGGAGP
jgi:hypothetical protein